MWDLLVTLGAVVAVGMVAFACVMVVWCGIITMTRGWGRGDWTG